MARPLLARLPGKPGWIVLPGARTFGKADRGYSDQKLREHIRGLGARPVIPTRRSQPAERHLEAVYANRQQVERLWGRLKEWRAVATRDEKTVRSFHGVLCLAATNDRIKI